MEKWGVKGAEYEDVDGGHHACVVADGGAVDCCGEADDYHGAGEAGVVLRWFCHWTAGRELMQQW